MNTNNVTVRLLKSCQGQKHNNTKTGSNKLVRIQIVYYTFTL